MTWFHEKRIVVPFDFSEESKEAVKVGRTLVARPDDLHIVHVLPPLNAVEPAVIWDAISDESRKEHVREAMQKELAGCEITGAQLNAAIGDPGHVITDLAQEVGAGLIVIPSHGRTGFSRLLLGSVAERVVRLAQCPVLVLKKSH